MNRDEGAYQLPPTNIEPIDLHPQPGGRRGPWQSDLACFSLLTPTEAYLRILSPFAFLSFEKDGCQPLKPSTIILYFLAMFKEPLNLIST